MGYVGRKFKSRDGYNCEITKRVTFDKTPCQSKYEVLFENGESKVFSYNSLWRGSFSLHRTNSPEYQSKLMIGKHFTSNEGFDCQITKVHKLGKIASSTVYTVQFEDGYTKNVALSKLRSKSGFIKKNNHDVEYVGKEFTSRDGYKCTIVERRTFDKTPSMCKWLVKFEDGLEREFIYTTLTTGFLKNNVAETGVVGKKVTSSDGYDGIIVERLTFDKTPSNCRYKVRFEDGTEVEGIYHSLVDGTFRKHSKTYMNYIGKKFTSKDGYTCEIVEQVTFDKTRSQCKFKVRFEDGFENVFSYQSLKSGRMKKYTNNYIGRKFTSKDGYTCEIIDKVENNSQYDQASKGKYRVRFEDGYETDICFSSLRDKTFSRFKSQSKVVVGQKYTSKDGYEYIVLKQIEADAKFYEAHYVIEFEDGFKKICNYQLLVYGKMSKYGRNDNIKLIEPDPIVENYYLCRCVKCKMKNLLTYEEIYKHDLSHRNIQTQIVNDVDF